MPPGLDRTKRIVIRATLVTSSTAATILGAQSLAFIDQQRQAAADATDTTEVSEPATAAPLPTLVPTVAPTLQPRTPAAAAPTIVILRGSNQATAPQPTSIQPPVPVQVAAPPPIVQQQPAPPPIVVQSAPQQSSPRSRGSR